MISGPEKQDPDFDPPSGKQAVEKNGPFYNRAMNMKMTSKTGSASPNAALQFIFSTFGILTWLSTIMKLPADSALTLGVIEISLGIGAFTGSILALTRGDVHGNVNLVLSVILGFAGGITQVIMVESNRLGIPFHPWISAVIILLGGIFVTAILPTMSDMPLYEWLSHVCVALGFLCSSIGTLAGISWLHTTGAWFLLAFGVTGMYFGISLMYEAMGKRIPQGRSLTELLHGMKA